MVLFWPASCLAVSCNSTDSRGLEWLAEEGQMVSLNCSEVDSGLREGALASWLCVEGGWYGSPQPDRRNCTAPGLEDTNDVEGVKNYIESVTDVADKPR